MNPNEIDLVKLYEEQIYKFLDDVFKGRNTKDIVNDYDYLFYCGNESKLQNLWDKYIVPNFQVTHFFDDHISTPFQIYWALTKSNYSPHGFNDDNDYWLVNLQKRYERLIIVKKRIKVCFDNFRKLYE